MSEKVESSLSRDRDDEMVFRKAVGDTKSFETELEGLVKIYNEQLDALSRLRVDLEMDAYLILAEPSERKHLDAHAKVSSSLTKKRKLISIIRKQIVTLKQLEKENGKKD